LANIRDYAECLFKNDEEQKQTFESLTAAFVVKLYERSNVGSYCDIPSRKKRCMALEQRLLMKVNRRGPLVCFLSGPGGTGKSYVITSYVQYCRELCSNLGVKFDSRTIVVTAITGAAAVSIRGETTSSALCLNREIKQDDIDKWEYTYDVIVDEISFSKKSEIITMEKSAEN
jgi:AAA domain